VVIVVKLSFHSAHTIDLYVYFAVFSNRFEQVGDEDDNDDDMTIMILLANNTVTVYILSIF